jgi:hypothetical protein
MVDENRDVQNIPHAPKRRMLDSERELMRVNRSLNDGGVDHRNHEAHLAVVRDRGSASAHQPQKVPYPSAVGGLRTLIDKVGGSR